MVVAHNYKYDYKIISAELIRNKIENPLSEIQSYCTMESTIEFCNLETAKGLKYPTLPQLHFKATGMPLKNNHEAFSDTIMLREAFWGLFINKVFEFNLESSHFKQFKAVHKVLPIFIANYRVRKAKESLQQFENEINQEILITLQKREKTKKNERFIENSKLLLNAIQMLINFEKVLANNESKATAFINNYIGSFKENSEINNFISLVVLQSDIKGIRIVEQFEQEIREFSAYFLKKGFNLNDFDESFDKESDKFNTLFKEYEKKLFTKIQSYISEKHEIHKLNSYLQSKSVMFNMARVHNNHIIKGSSEGCYIATLCVIDKT